MISPAIQQASQHLLDHGFGPEAVNEALRMVGTGLKVDRVYVFEDGLHEGRRVARQVFEWSAESVEPQLDNPLLQRVDYAEVMPQWAVAFDAGEVVQGCPHEFCSPTREVLESQSIKSVLVCPIYVGRNCWGFVGFDDCTTERRWPFEELTALRQLAKSLASALRYHESMSLLEHSRALLRELLPK
jgi:GAF domain-containing protein